ncbi:MAG: 5-(carboxyamino)imidazole ribonucleotide synthase [Verrucomicrobiales bacterium]|jgi:5-(carboxyamino)imidazole ribonucleotide synthase|nr:5-(carboxyamino)imidazole ribonucleotide synthase [Verrucomicrobiales bacterium]
MIPPGSTIGLLGGGQLGRMFAISARKMGYGIQVFEPSPNCPTGQVADAEFNAPYSDIAALQKFAANCDVITYEFENIPVSVLDQAGKITPLFPDASILHICQNREREKLFLRASNIPCAPFEVVRSAAELASAFDKIGFPCVLKTADFGYDGKGQVKFKERPANVEETWKQFGAPAGVLEGWVNFSKELSVIVARGRDAAVSVFPVSENIHTNHILDFSIVPARIEEKIQEQARGLAIEIAEKLKLVGLLAVEMFLGANGELIVNELAPRPHNSGHYSFDACVTSQFEQHLRAVCGLPLGSTELLSPVVMVNILGDAWQNHPPHFDQLLANSNVKLHLYGKTDPKPGRKMGHFCVFGPDSEVAYQMAVELKKVL